MFSVNKEGIEEWSSQALAFKITKVVAKSLNLNHSHVANQLRSMFMYAGKLVVKKSCRIFLILEFHLPSPTRTLQMSSIIRILKHYMDELGLISRMT